jgi:alpha-beta hydrolase superfamily lysophospholipase
MLFKKTIFIIPGYRQNPINKAYREISIILKKNGYHPILITIPWKNTTISQNADYFIRQYKKVYREKKYIMGFSFGAMIALLASTKVKASGLILCSLSPFFKEDLVLKKGIKKLSINQQLYQDLIKLQCSILAKKIKTNNVLLLYGSRETKSLINRTTQTYNQINKTNKRLIKIKNTSHDLGDKKYLNKISQITKFFN